ncbi:MAG: hypothetical protein VX938_12440 [Myxococcota bacterium]|nr:hypothetical protein [Myxococcota bacterium]MEE2779684.1 hypothetical protein [Myxococcota bacterium]
MKTVVSRIQLFMSSLVLVWVSACQAPAPPCDCDAQVAEAVEKALAEAKAAAPKPTAAAPLTARTIVPRSQGVRSRGVSARASGAVSTRPGAGPVVKQSDEARAAMKKSFSDFLAAAEARKLGPIAPFLTQRLSTVLQQKAAQYEPRFFRGLEETLGQVSTGVEMGETRDAGQGNVEALFRFGSGHERRVVFFQEEGAWKLNRL